MYTLIGSHTSPYVRKIRLYLISQNLPFEFKPINYLEEKDAIYLKSINPINKIPILLINNEPLFDSRVIFNRLNKTPLSLKEENILSGIDAAMDTAINLFSLRRGGLDISTTENLYIKRQIERLDLIFNYLSPYATEVSKNPAANWNFLTMSLFSFLFWANFREIVDLSPYQALKDFLVAFNHLPGVEETAIL